MTCNSYRIVSYDFEDFLSYPFNKQTRGCENNTATESGGVSISVRRHHLHLKYKTETKNETNAKQCFVSVSFQRVLRTYTKQCGDALKQTYNWTRLIRQ